MNKRIIPYPGLRPFSEEESIFFKGRDIHIKQIINQLQDKKIVIVTGASGAGKSSLIFAGVVPNARAGFFKAFYNNWAVVSFRPERSPLENLSRELARELDEDYQNVLSELRYGFSALVNVYKQSKYYVDTESKQWKLADEQERKQMKAQGANLLIIADQFEEFFTNPENFAGGKPSVDAYTTVNLLLETASIALRQNLPIYIIFTMRSDFISDCVAFKGLPEYIGFSQFFVPRLKRNELQQVIEEPAKLAGGSVSKRLTEVMINQLREGFDQLPILQHALHQLWITAGYGQEELDLIHLAKIAGLGKAYLDEEDKQIFSVWFESLPENQKKYFENPSLANVLNYHANTLYDNAYQYYLENTPWVEDKSVISKQDAEYIIRTAFLGLTRIDEGRAVRNRMTLKEITNLINDPKITYGIVNGVLNIFRETDSTFIRPFIDPDDIKTYYIPADTVLDITHEALIRNWQLLQRWEHEEEENVNDFLEFKVQLKRWLDSGKKKDYLLPLGTLTYFEGWYERCKPNKYWIAKYDKSEADKEKKLQRAEQLAQDIKEYLEASRQYIIAQEKRKRRIRRILAAIAVIIIFILAGFTTWALREKHNADIQRQLAEKQKNEAIRANKIAERERQRAEMEKERAEKEKERAEQEARKALLAKRKADSAKNIALKMMALAQQQKQIAQMEALRAMREKRKADSLRNIAEVQKQKAIQASQKAMRLTLLSLAQSLAFKATQKYDDKQVNLLLAYYAYLLNQQNGGKEYDPVIYHGLLFSYFLVNNIHPIRLADQTIMSFDAKDENTLIYQTIDGQIYNFDLLHNEKTQLYHKRRYLPKVPVMTGIFVNKFLIVPDIAGQMWIFNTERVDNEVFAQRLFIKNLLPDTMAFYSLTSSNKVISWRVKSNMQVKQVKEYPLDFNAKFLLHGRGDTLYVVGNYGGVWKLDLTTGNTSNLRPSRGFNMNSIATSAAISPDRKYLAIGFADGEIDLIKTADFTRIDAINVVNSLVKLIRFDATSQKLIVVSPDNTINIYTLETLHERPIVINVGNGKIQDIKIVDGQLYVLYENKTFLKFYLEPSKYALLIRQEIKRNFTNREWELFFDNTLPKFDIIK